MPRGTQVKRDGLAIIVERRGTSRGITLRHLSRPWLRVRSAKDHTGRDCHQAEVSGVGLSRQSGLKVYRGPPKSSRPNYTWGTPGINNCGGSIRWFPFRYWGNLLCAYWSPWPTFFPIHFRNGTVWTSQKVLFQLFFILQLRFCAIFTRVSDCARISLTPFGEGYT